MGIGLSSPDRIHLQRAVEIGRQGWGGVHPNPLVGCVLVKDGEVVAEGWHERHGEAHAEVIALGRAGDRARGATAYVSLEPCAHFGHTPPCASALISAGVARVVFGAADPGRESRGGAMLMREGGVEVVGPALTHEEGSRENPAFFFNCRHDATYLALKMAQTLDGRIAEAPGRRTLITGPEARVETHRLRAGHDAVLVGFNTVETDDPLLTVREDVPYRGQPTRLVLDTWARLSVRARLFEDLPEAPLVVFTGPDAGREEVTVLQEYGATVHRVPKAEVGLSLRAVLEVCWATGIRSILCEGGRLLASQLLKEGLASRMYLLVAPFVLGEKGVPAFVGLESREHWEAWRPTMEPRWLGRDLLLTLDRTD